MNNRKNRIGISIVGIILLVITILFFISLKLNAGPNDIVYIPDKVLKEEINKKLGFSTDHNVTESEMLNLKQVGVFDGSILYYSFFYEGLKEVKNLEGLQYAKNLNELLLSEAKIKDYSILQNLPLKKLRITRSHLKEIPKLPLSLEELDLSINEIGKIEGLDNNTSLDTLSLEGNKISKIEGLDKLTNLIHLDLQHNQISKIEGLDKLIKLKYLALSYNEITKIEGLDKLENLILGLALQHVDLDIKSKEFEAPKIMYINDVIDVTIADEFKNNITKIGENRYRIDYEGIKKLNDKKEILNWYKLKEFNGAADLHNHGGNIEFGGKIYATATLKEKDLFEPKIDKNRKVKVGERLDITTLLLNKPENARVEVVSDINTNSLGKKRGKIKVIFSDGSFKEVDIEVFVNTLDVQINYINKKMKL